VVIEQTVRQEVPDMQLSCAKARQDLGWKARYTFAEALRETCTEYRENFERYQRQIFGP
jgi:nucleoside-diphosphate-sugar epimerase